MNGIRKLLFRFARFITVRNGPDQLGTALLLGGFALQIAIPLTGFYWLMIISYGLYGLFLFFFDRFARVVLGMKKTGNVFSFSRTPA